MHNGYKGYHHLGFLTALLNSATALSNSFCVSEVLPSSYLMSNFAEKQPQQSSSCDTSLLALGFSR